MRLATVSSEHSDLSTMKSDSDVMLMTATLHWDMLSSVSSINIESHELLTDTIET
jgi:hypothetical protein